MSTRSLLVAVGLMVVMLGALSFLQKKVPGTERMAKESRRITDMPVREASWIDLKGPRGEFINHWNSRHYQYGWIKFRSERYWRNYSYWYY